MVFFLPIQSRYFDMGILVLFGKKIWNICLFERAEWLIDYVKVDYFIFQKLSIIILVIHLILTFLCWTFSGVNMRNALIKRFLTWYNQKMRMIWMIIVVLPCCNAQTCVKHFPNSGQVLYHINISITACNTWILSHTCAGSNTQTPP